MVIRNLLIFILVAVVSSCQFKSEKADTILHNGYIYTINEKKEVHQALVIKDGRILDVGPEHYILNKYSAQKKIDLQGKPVYPGFIDAHCHFLGLGESLLWADLNNTNSYSEVMENLKSYNSRFSHEWILGRGWDQNDWEKQEFPTNKELNEMYPDRPVYLVRIDGHAALVNDVALELAGITCYTEISGGEIQKENEACTGVLVDNAMDLVSKLIPEFSDQDKELALKLAEKKCIESGLTTLHDAGLHYKDILFIDSLQKLNELNIGVYAMFSDIEENYKFLENNSIKETESLQASSFKFYADGALGSYGACLIQPYADRFPTTGFLLKDPDYYKEKAEWIFDHNLQMNTHCIGDSANRVILEIYSEVLKTSNDLRWRIEHCQVVAPEDLIKFREYNIIPSVQPLHATSDYPWFIERLGLERARSAYSYKELLSQAGLVALGTDFPIESYKPLNTYYAAVFRRDMDGNPVSGVQPENALTRMEAIKGMTLWPALASFQEKNKGTIEINKLADLVILDRDILKVDEKYLTETKVASTYIRGKEVFKNSEVRN